MLLTRNQEMFISLGCYKFTSIETIAKGSLLSWVALECFHSFITPLFSSGLVRQLFVCLFVFQYWVLSCCFEFFPHNILNGLVDFFYPSKFINMNLKSFNLDKIRPKNFQWTLLLLSDVFGGRSVYLIVISLGGNIVSISLGGL